MKKLFKKTKKLYSINARIALLAVTLISILTTTDKIFAAIPEYKGLYTLFENQDKQLREKAREMEIERSLKEDNIDSKAPEKIDPISYGQTMLYSGVIENIYTYCHEGNTARKVIETLWLKHLIDQAGNFNNEARFNLSNYFPVTKFIPEDIGKIIKYIRDFSIINDNGTKKTDEQLKSSRETFIKKFPKNRLRSGNNYDKLDKFIKDLENLKCDPNFYEETAEAILWAFFEAKFYGQEAFLQCLDQISPDLKNNLNELYDFDSVKEELLDYEKDAKILKEAFNKLLSIDYNSITPQLQDYKDKLIYLAIKSLKNNDVPPAIQLIKVKHNKKMENESTTCFESSILELISILLYNKKIESFDPCSFLPEEIINNRNFINFIKNIFYENGIICEQTQKTITNELDPKNLIDPKKINSKTKKFTKMLTNINNLAYGKSADIEGIEFKYDLSATFENLIKVLNKIFDLGFKITDTPTLFQIQNKEDLNIKITKQAGKFYSIAEGLENNIKCKNILNAIEKKLSKNKHISINNFEIKSNRDPIGEYKSIVISFIISETNLSISLSGGHGEITVQRNNYESFEKFENIFRSVMNKKLYDLKNETKNPENFSKSALPLILLYKYKIDMQTLSLLLPGSQILSYITNLYSANKEDLELIIKNKNLQEIISKKIKFSKEDQVKLFWNIVDIKLKYLKNENFLDKELIEQTNKIIYCEKSHITDNFKDVLSCLDSIEERKNTLLLEDCKKLREEIIFFIARQLEGLDKTNILRNIIQFYKKNIKSKSQNQAFYKEKLEEIISEFFTKPGYCKDFDHIKEIIETETNTFENDFLMNQFEKIISNEKTDFKYLLNLIISTNNEKAFSMLPKEALLFNKFDNQLVNANNPYMLKILLELKDFKVNPSNYDNRSALIAAIKDKNIEKFKLLINQSEIDVNAQQTPDGSLINQPGNIPLIEAILQLFKNKKIPLMLDMLLWHKDIDVNKKDLYNRTALHELIDLYCCNLLLQTDDEKNEVIKGFVRKLLSRRDINLNIKSDGLTPIAKAKKHKETFSAKNYTESKKVVEKMQELIDLIEDSIKIKDAQDMYIWNPY